MPGIYFFNSLLKHVPARLGIFGARPYKNMKYFDVAILLVGVHLRKSILPSIHFFNSLLGQVPARLGTFGARPHKSMKYFDVAVLLLVARPY